MVRWCDVAGVLEFFFKHSMKCCAATRLSNAPAMDKVFLIRLDMPFSILVEQR